MFLVYYESVNLRDPTLEAEYRSIEASGWLLPKQNKNLSSLNSRCFFQDLATRHMNAALYAASFVLETVRLVYVNTWLDSPHGAARWVPIAASDSLLLEAN
jgi:hypothetical protein